MSAGLIIIRKKIDAMHGEGSIYYATLQGYIIFDRSGETYSPARVSTRFTDQVQKRAGRYDWRRVVNAFKSGVLFMRHM